MSEPAREPYDAWAGPSGLRVERLAAPRGLATLALEPGPAGEPMWLTPAQWADLCDAARALGPEWAALPEPEPEAAAEPGPLPAAAVRAELPGPPA